MLETQGHYEDCYKFFIGDFITKVGNEFCKEVKELIDKEDEDFINHKNPKGDSLLSLALSIIEDKRCYQASYSLYPRGVIWRMKLRIIYILLNNGANIDQFRDVIIPNISFLAIKTLHLANHFEDFQKVLNIAKSKGANMNSPFSIPEKEKNNEFFEFHFYNGMTALGIFIYHCKEQHVQSILKAGADPSAKDHRGKTPMFYASTSTLDILIQLMEEGADISQVKDSIIPRISILSLVRAIHSHSNSLVDPEFQQALKLAIARGANINGVLNEGKFRYEESGALRIILSTPFEPSIKKKYIELLLDQGANIEEAKRCAQLEPGENSEIIHFLNERDPKSSLEDIEEDIEKVKTDTTTTGWCRIM